MAQGVNKVLEWEHESVSLISGATVDTEQILEALLSLSSNPMMISD